MTRKTNERTLCCFGDALALTATLLLDHLGDHSLVLQTLLLLEALRDYFLTLDLSHLHESVHRCEMERRRQGHASAKQATLDYKQSGWSARLLTCACLPHP